MGFVFAKVAVHCLESCGGTAARSALRLTGLKESLNKSFDKPKTNGKRLIPVVASPSINSGEPCRTLS
jgi:hypothetical protein